MRRAFFRSRFRQVLLLILLPVLLFAVLSSMFTYVRVKSEAHNKSMLAVELIAQNMEALSEDLDYYRVSIDYDPQMNLAIIKALLNHQMSYQDHVALRKAMNYLNTLSNAKAYLDSIYVTMKGSPYLITQGNRQEIANFADNVWQEEITVRQEPYWFEPRNIKSYHLDETGTDVITIYQNMKYQQVLIINIVQGYFNRWLESIHTYDGQVLMVLDKQNQVLFQSNNYSELSPQLITQVFKWIEQNTNLQSITEAQAEWNINRDDRVSFSKLIGGYYVNVRISNRFGLWYLSLIPASEVLRLPTQIIHIAIVVMMVCVFLASILAVVWTARDYEQIQKIIDVLEHAEKCEYNQTFAEESKKDKVTAKSNRNAPYFYIINNIINLFVSQSYLNVQLEARKYALMAAQLTALQYQLNPHFLFNTLQSIDLEILKSFGGPTAANAMVNHLSELLRYSLEDPMKKVKIAREIEMTRHYVALQKQKKRNRFEVTWEYQTDVLQYHTFRLILQPLIENSLTHGVAEIQKLWIKVKIIAIGNHIRMYVIDNGIGIEKPRLVQLQQELAKYSKLQSQDHSPETEIGGEGMHIGLENIAKRVKLNYASGEVFINSKYGMGTIITVQIEKEKN